MALASEVVDRLLVAKGLLGPIRFVPTANPDRKTLARHILTAHDAAEMALAAIAQHLRCPSKKSQVYLMDYVAAIQTVPGRKVTGRDYFSKLNQVRINVKHLGIFPDPKDWFRVGERTWEHVSAWCQRYLEVSLDTLDEAALISDPDVKRYYADAVDALHREEFKKTLEHLALACHALFKSNRALRNLHVGVARAEDAIKLATFGVHANDYLALQEFLPFVVSGLINHPNLTIRWEQNKYGHPANWTRLTAEFCIRTFVEVALRIQDAEWIPGAWEFDFVYEHKITALVDGVEIVQERRMGFLEPLGPVVLRTLAKDEMLRCRITPEGALQAAIRGNKPVLSIRCDDGLMGEVDPEKVRVTCVPIDHPALRKLFPELPEIEYDP